MPETSAVASVVLQGSQICRPAAAMLRFAISENIKRVHASFSGVILLSIHHRESRRALASPCHHQTPADPIIDSAEILPENENMSKRVPSRCQSDRTRSCPAHRDCVSL